MMTVLSAVFVSLVLFVLKHAAALTGILLVATAAGTVIDGARTPVSLRAALGLGVAGEVFIVLGAVGALRPLGISSFVVPVLVLGAARAGGNWRWKIGWKPLAGALAVVLPLLLLALHPPLAFDETLYHLPFVQRMAASGWLTFQPDLRNPLFPQLHEALCVPVFLALGDQATHLFALAETLILVALLVEWVGPGQRRAGFLAAAAVIGSPIVVYLSMITYVEMAMALFIAAGFRCLDGWDDLERHSNNALAAGFLFGCACCVKYHAWYFAAGGLLFLLLFGSNRRRAVPMFLLSFLVAVLPTYGLLVLLTGNPFFPYFARLFGESQWHTSIVRDASTGVRVTDAIRVFWDATFARQRLNGQPPYSPFFGIAFLVTVIAAFRNRRAMFLAILSAGYVAIFTFLPQDSRYLIALLPLLSIAAATAVVSWLGARPSARNITIGLCLVALTPGAAYAAYRLAALGVVPPVTADQRRLTLERRIPEYRALERRSGGPIYVCGAEQLKYFAGAEMVGDVVGPYPEGRLLGAGGSTANLVSFSRQLHIRYILISRRVCPPEWSQIVTGPRFERVYADADAELWRVLP
jgi:hypothetical protein